LQIGDNLLPRHKTVRIVAVIFGARQSSLPIGRVKRKRVPAMITPGVAWPVRLLQHHMLAALSGQIIADSKSGLPASNDDRVDELPHSNLLSEAANPNRSTVPARPLRDSTTALSDGFAVLRFIAMTPGAHH